MRTWVVVGHWTEDPKIWVQQVHGPFASKEAAQHWMREHRDPRWYWEAFALLGPEAASTQIKERRK